MLETQRQRTIRAFGLVLAAALASGPTAEAKPKKAARPYVFELTDVQAATKAGMPLIEPVRAAASQAITAHAELVDKVPEAAPDREKQPEAFARFVQKRGLRVYKVNAEITHYAEQVEEASEVTPRRLSVSIAVRMFGETVPKRVMAFTGDGSASIKIDIGKKIRAADTRYAREEAIKLAVADAIATSMSKLKAGPPKRKKSRKKK